MGEDDDNDDDKSYESDSSTWDLGGEETQIFDSQFCESPTSSFGNRCDGDTEQLHIPQNTIPFDETVMYGNEFAATQVMDPDGENQVMDPDGETQLVNLAGETQLVNSDAENEEMDNFDSVERNMSRLFNGYDNEEGVVSDHEGSDKTEIADDSDKDSGRGDCANSADIEHMTNRHQCKEDIKHYTPKTDCERSEHHTSGIDRKTFTSIRAACIRAAGLIALSKSPFCPALTSEPDIEHKRVLFQKIQSYDLEVNKLTDGQESENRCGFGRSTARTGHNTFTSTRAACIRAAGLQALSKSPSCPALNSEPDIEHKRVLFQNNLSYDLLEVKSFTNGQEFGNRCGFGRSTARKLFDENTLAENETKEFNDEFDLGGATNSPILDTELAGLSYINSQEPGDASQANALDFVDNFLKVNIECGNDFDIRRSTGDQSKPVLSAKGTQIFAKSVNVINEVDKRQTFCWDNNLEDEGGGEFYRKKKDVLFASGSQNLKSSVPYRNGRNLGQSDSKLALGKNNKLKKSLGTVIKDLTFRKNLIKELDKQSTDVPSGMDIQGTVQETTEVRFDTQMAAEAMEDLCFGLLEAGHDSTKTNVGNSHMQKGSHKTLPLPVSNEGVRTTRSKLKISGDLSKEVKRAKLGARESENLDNVASGVAKRTGKTTLKRGKFDIVDQISVKKQRVQNITPVARRTRQSINDNEPNKDINILTGFQSKGKRTSRMLSYTRKEIGAQSISRLTRSKAIGLTEQEKGSIRENFGQTLSGCVTPVSHGTPVKDLSPICMGDEYLKQSCGRSFLIQEVNGLFPTDPLIGSPSKDTRQRRDVSLIRVLFSRHLDGDIIKQQKKILFRLGASESSSMSDATHFIADNFARTRNMLEAIALGKPIVTHLWLESCGQACCHIDEKNFILRDAKKEREFGFTIPSSLARASKNPLLKGHRVLITPNTKPGKEILSSLVKAVHGVAVERGSGSSLNDDNVPEGLLILSCEEDYAVCLPFLEKGLAIYSSELLLNGIVIQRLEYERHRLFLDHVKRTR